MGKEYRTLTERLLADFYREGFLDNYRKAIWQVEVQRAAVGDTAPAEWDEHALDTFLSLIGNCEEEGE